MSETTAENGMGPLRVVFGQIAGSLVCPQTTDTLLYLTDRLAVAVRVIPEFVPVKVRV